MPFKINFGMSGTDRGSIVPILEKSSPEVSGNMLNSLLATKKLQISKNANGTYSISNKNNWGIYTNYPYELKNDAWDKWFADKFSPIPE
jgi:hypothetical protein